MPTGRISKTTIEGLIPGASDKYLWDNKVSGFGIKVTPRGCKTYLLQYRIGGRRGRTRRVTIGRHGKNGLTPSKARTIALEHADLVRRGIDPRGAADERKNTPNFGDAWELYRSFQIERGKSRPLGSKSRAGWKQRTADENSRLASKFLLPRFRNRIVTEMEKSDVVRLHGELAATPRQANLCLQLLKGMFNWLQKYGYPYPSPNPVIGIERYDEIARNRYLNEPELRRLGRAISEYEANATRKCSLVQISEVNALRLLIFSGMRKSEVLGLKWEWVDFASNKILLPDSKTGAKEVVLNDPAVSCIKAQERIVDNPYVFIGGNTGGHLATISRIWERVRKQASVEDVRIHDLRHTVGSTGVAVGAHLRLIAGILGHQSTRTTERYVHADLTPLQNAADAIGNKIANALNNKQYSE